MNVAETTKVLALVKGLCPAQRIEDLTLDIWHAALADTRYADAAEAIRRLARRELDLGANLWLQPGHLLAEVRKLRSDRLLTATPVAPPRWLEPGSPEELDWMRDEQIRIMDGRPRLREVGR